VSYLIALNFFTKTKTVYAFQHAHNKCLHIFFFSTYVVDIVILFKDLIILIS